ncbi:hypothetical protein [Pseudoalteromonas phenolica]|uniref:DUF4402 domain-containing protein n=1 Tax=Pseudoalteromonas phenolica TaxID=161398 RepID=A0A0S2JZI4_9GAMM|nr:hypothetical protein [Pseudoalteromonas phenolica]ALO41626.1 hypothetical protein PP2015_1110 [Pseudoalteromonas phenolica]MBE0353824.1 hypothetical protein [Pseudoalteromonas phenolica O-BC30]RXE91747.1 hypothetical protein D9981_22150 [Pseudoalteromonas phenolica O-BC30]TMO57264.1 hypothetical protein CWC21_05130 [Pseudoalteromonas phenolica]
MNKKLLFSAALLAATSSSIFASSQTFQASINGWSEPTFSEANALHFGKVRLAAGSTCTMDNAGAVTGDCDASDANIQLGGITVSGLAPSSAMNITVSGSTGSNLTFAPATTATDGTSTTTTADGVASAFTTDASATDITINVYGQVTVDNALTAEGNYTVDYTVDVSFQ